MSRTVQLPGNKYVYDNDDIIGEGLQGRVYIGLDVENNEKVAIKVSIQCSKHKFS